MHKLSRTWPSLFACVLMLVGALASVALILYDRYVLGLQFLPEALRPRTGVVYVLRSCGMLLSASLLVWGIQRSGAVQEVTSPRGAARLAVSTQLVLALVGSAVLVLSPRVYSALLVEDGLAENLTVLGFMIAGLLAGVGAFRGQTPGQRFGLTMVCFVLLLVAGEEISWGQRLFGIESGQVFREHNLQGETNLHNFASNAFEAVFYCGATFWFVVVPFLETRTGWVSRVPVLRDVLPPSWSVFAAAPMSAFVYDQWDVIFIQLAFWTSLAVCVALGLRAGGQTRGWAIATALCLSITQATQLAFGYRAARPWDPTELRELAIAVLAVSWAAHMRRRAACVPVQARERGSLYPSMSEPHVR